MFVLLTSAMAIAQPGYRGKKISISYNILVSPALSSHNYNSNIGLTAFNSQNIFSVDYVVSRKKSIGLIYSYSRTALQYFPEELGDESFDDVAPIKIFTNGLGLRLRFYKGKPGSIAPLGKYNEIEFHLLKSRVHEIVNEKDMFNTTKFLFIYGIGKQRVVFDRVLLEYGLRFGLVPGALLALGSDQSSLEKRVGLRILGQQGINFKIGFGFLAR